MHLDANIISEDRWDCSTKLRYPMYVYWLTFLGVMTVMGFLQWIAEGYKYVHPVVSIIRSTCTVS